MKTLIAALVALAMIAGPANAESLSNDNMSYLVDRYTTVTGEAPSAEIMATFAEMAALPVDLTVGGVMSPGAHAGEIWTDCYAIFGENCSFTDVSGTATYNGSCSNIPIADPYWQWIANPSVIQLGEGFHVAWTNVSPDAGFHNSAEIAGINCVYDYPGFLQLTYSNGVANFA